MIFNLKTSVNDCVKIECNLDADKKSRVTGNKFVLNGVFLIALS